MKLANEKIVLRVKKLLNLAEDNWDDEEGQSAFIFAQKLMIQHQISNLDLLAAGVKVEQEGIAEEAITIYKTLHWWEKSLASIIAKNFRVKVFFNNSFKSSRVKRRIVFYGYGTDLELAKEMYVLAYDAILVYQRRYSKRHQNDGFTAADIKNTYLQGYLAGLKKKFNDQVSALKGKYEVAIVVPQAVEDAYKEYSKDFGRPLRNQVPYHRVDTQVYQDGYQDGQRLDLTKKTIDQESLV